MKTISLDELHRQTDEFVHLAITEDVVVIEDGLPIIVLKRFTENSSASQRWDEREQALASISQLGADSGDVVSMDRDGR